MEKPYDMDKKHTSYFLNTTEFTGVPVFLDCGFPVKEVAFARDINFTLANYTEHFPDEDEIPDQTMVDFANSEEDWGGGVVYIRLVTPMSLQDLANIWNTVRNINGPFHGSSIDHPRVRPALNCFKKEHEYIKRAPDWMHDFSKNYDLTQYNLYPYTAKAPVVKPSAVVKSTAAAKPPTAQPKPVQRATNDTVDTILALLSVPMDVIAIAKAASADKTTVNRTLYQLKAAGKVRVISGFGVGTEKGKPVWKAV
jgi:hypothetical protein